MEMVSSTSPPEKTALKPTAPSNHQLIVPVASNRGNNSTLQAPLNSPGKVEKNGHAKESHHTAKVFEIHSLPNGKTRNLLKAVIRRKLSQQKEKKATQMLAIVLGESVPWLPRGPCGNPSPHVQCRLIFQPPSEFVSPDTLEDRQARGCPWRGPSSPATHSWQCCTKGAQSHPSRGHLGSQKGGKARGLSGTKGSRAQQSWHL